MSNENNNKYTLNDIKNKNRSDTNPKRTPTVDNEKHNKGKISIDHTAKLDTENIKQVNVYDIAGKKEESREPVSNRLFDELDKAVEKDKQKIVQLQDKVLEEWEKAALDAEFEEVNDVTTKLIKSEESVIEYDDLKDLLDDDDDIIEPIKIVQHNNNEIKNNYDKIEVKENIEFQPTEDNTIDISAHETNDEKLLKALKEEDDDLDDDLLNDEEPMQDQDSINQKIVDSLKKQAKENIIPIKNKVDLNKFSVRKKPISISKLMKINNMADTKIADWVLLSENKPISCSALSGMEITKLNPSNSTRNRLNTFKDVYKIIYNHVIDDNKPKFESWLKTLHYHDLDHVYFALYKATFAGSNFINRQCNNTKCNNAFIEDILFEDMVKYKDDSIKEKVEKILRKNVTSDDEYEIELKQVSDDYIVGLKLPSVWNVIIETASLSTQFLETYADIIDLYSYIDEIYYINRESEELIPVDTKPDADNQVKTISNKIRIYHNIIKNLTTDQYYELYKYIRTMEENIGGITYAIPSSVCPICGSKIDEMETSADQLLFTRHQLGALATM